MNILEKLDWLEDTVEDAYAGDEGAIQALAVHSVAIAEGLLKVAYTLDPVVQEVQQKLVERSVAGMLKFGQSMEEAAGNEEQWIDSTVEELLDAANYLTKLKRMRKA